MAKIFFVGDFCSRPAPDIITVDDDVKSLIASADVAACNFEVPLKPDSIKSIAAGATPEQAGYFYQNDASPAFLEKLGFNLFSLATNHTMDCGIDGFRKTSEAFAEKSILLGAGKYDEAYTVKTVEIDGLVIGFLALCYAHLKGGFHDLRERARCGDAVGVAFINDMRVNHIIMEAKKKVDFLMVMAHDGVEYIDVPVPETIARYRDLIDYGADAVIGSHPHCPQGWETYQGKPIFYSLGNFFFNSRDVDHRVTNRPHWYDSLGVMLDVSREQGVRFEVYNLKNSDNRRIMFDNTPEREKQNRILCSLLQNKEKYWNYYNTTAAKEIYANACNAIQLLGLTPKKSRIKYHVVSLLKILSGKDNVRHQVKSYINLTQNTTRISALLHLLRKFSNDYNNDYKIDN